MGMVTFLMGSGHMSFSLRLSWKASTLEPTLGLSTLCNRSTAKYGALIDISSVSCAEQRRQHISPHCTVQNSMLLSCHTTKEALNVPSSIFWLHSTNSVLTQAASTCHQPCLCHSAL